MVLLNKMDTSNSSRWSQPEARTKDYDVMFKVLLLGDSNVGKTTLLSRLDTGVFSHSHIPTIGVDFKTKKFEIDDTIVKVQYWDTAGQERFSCMTPAFYRAAHAIMIVFDITNRDSFNHIRKWLNEIDMNAGVDHEIPKVVVGNKSDLRNRRDVSPEEIDNMMIGIGGDIPYFEVSAFDGTNVDEAFRAVPMEVLRRRHLRELQEDIRIENERKAGTRRLISGKNGTARKSNFRCVIL